MACKYVKDFTFAKSPPRPSIPGYNRGGAVSTPKRYKDGGLGESAHPGVPSSPGFTPSYKYLLGADKIKASGTVPPNKVAKGLKAGPPAKGMAKGGHWIAGAIKHPGALHKELGVKKGEKIPAAKLAKAAKHGGVEGKRARLAETLKGFRHKDGGSIDVAEGKVKDGKKTPWNADDEVSPGSYKRTPPNQSRTNKQDADDNFDGQGRNREPATKQTGNVERMSGWSDFKKGGKVHKKAAGGVVATKKEVPSGKAGSIQDGREIKSGTAYGPNDGKDNGMRKGGRVHKKAGGGQVTTQDRYETLSTKDAAPSSTGTSEQIKGTMTYSQGGLSRGTSPKKNAAIHARMKKPSAGALSKLLSAASASQGPPGMGGSPSGMGGPPGMAPGMGAPPGGQMGAMQGPMGPPMAHGGSVRHVVVHHLSHRK